MSKHRIRQWNAGSGWRRIMWSSAMIMAASSGLFFGLGQSAQSDIAKYEALLAKSDRVHAEAVVRLNVAGLFALRHVALDKILSTDVSILELNTFETDSSFLKVKIANDADLAKFLEDANKNPGVAYAEPNYRYRISDATQDIYPIDTSSPDEVVPTHPDFVKLWGLRNTGQVIGGTAGKVGVDIAATKAWVTTKGSKDIVVAVIDTGVDYNNLLLKDNIYANPGESGSGKETNGVDDDGNGFIDDFHGWNFANGTSTNNPMDDHSHGTHCSGTIGASGANGGGIVGVNWTVSIMPIKFLDAGGGGSLVDAVKAIQYATKMRVNIMSNSWGGGGFSQAMFDAIKEAKDKGVLFAAAAGNDGVDNDKSSYPNYPSSYQSENVIAVAASTNVDTLATFSNFGQRTVHIAAPGLDVYSTVLKDKFDTYSGTSMATPHLAGAAALLWSTDKAMTYDVIKDRLLRSRDYVGTFARKVSSGGRLNVYNAINGVFPPAPAEPRESDWKDFALATPIESAHPYANNAAQEWTVQGPADAKFVRVVFGKIDVESGYDYIKIKDATGAEIDSITGQMASYNSYYAAGNKVTISFKADYDVTAWGFTVAKVQVVY